jgi:putative membrane protein
MVFRGVGSSRYLLLIALVVIPFIMSLYARVSVIMYVKSLIIYGIIFLTVLISLRAATFTPSYRGFGTTTSLLNTVFAVFIDLLVTLITRRFIVGFGVLSSVLPLSAMMMALRGVENNGNSLRRYIIYPLYTLPGILIVQFASYVLIGTVNIIKFIALDSIFYAFSLLFIYYVVFKFETSYGGIDILRLFSSYLYAALFEYPEPFERELSRKAIIKDAKVHLFMLHGEDSVSAVTIPELHAGPIAKVGGGYLISDVVNELSRYVNPVIYMHGIGSHELDPATRVDVRRVARAVAQRVRESLNDDAPSGYDCIGRISVQIQSNGFRVTHIPLCGKSLVIISRLIKSSDDIPLSIYERIKEKVKLDWDNTIFIDAQNYYSDDNTWDENDINELATILNRIAELEPQRLNIKSCVSHVPKHAFGPIQFEIGDNGLVTWGLEINGKKVLLVIFDGNNLRRKVADSIISEFRRYFDIVEVLTTDNHQYTGIARFTRSRGYKIIGDSISHNLIMRNVRRSVKQCLDNMESIRIEYYPVIINGVRLVGDSFNDMVRAAERGVADWMKHFTVLIVLPILTIIILSVLFGIL